MSKRKPLSPPVPATPALRAVPPPEGQRPDILFVPTPPAVVDGMLMLARVTSADVLYDLGCGDGRIVIAAAQRHGARCVGIDIDPVRITQARAAVTKAGLDHLVTIVHADLFADTTDIRDATVVTLYLLPSLNVKLLPKLHRDLRPGTRVVSHDFDMGEAWRPLSTLTVGGKRVYAFEVSREDPAVPMAVVPRQAITADELRDALTWHFPITPSRVMLCRHLGQEDLLFEGIVPLPLQGQLAAQGGELIKAADGLTINPEFTPVLESYAVKVALEPRVIARPPAGEPAPAEPAGSIGVWRLPLAVLVRLFAEGVNRVLEVRPITATFPGADDAAVDGPALPGEGVRPTPEPVADSRRD